MVAGQSRLGKTTFLATLFDGLLTPPRTEESQENAIVFAPTKEIKAYNLGTSRAFMDFQYLLFVYVQSWRPSRTLASKLKSLTLQDMGMIAPLRLSTLVCLIFINPLWCVRARMLLEFLERQFDKVFEEEQRIHRNPKFEEHRVHALLYFLEPTALGLKQFDIDFMKLLASRVNVIPVIAKADGLTVKERESFKTKVRAQLSSPTLML